MNNSFCQSDKKTELKANSDFREKYCLRYHKNLNYFSRDMIDHFPKNVSDTSAMSTNIEDTSKIDHNLSYFSFMYWEQLPIQTLKQKIDSLNLMRVPKRSVNDSSFLLLTFFDRRLDSKQQDRSIKRGDVFSETTPLPYFELFDQFKGNTFCGLEKDFVLYILNSCESSKLPSKYKMAGYNCFPSKWQHGYSKGVAVSEKRRIILYWIVCW